MLKKLASLLFEEEEVEEPAPKPVKKITPEPVIEEPAPLPAASRSFESIAADEPQPVKESVIEEPVQAKPVIRESILADAPKPVITKPIQNTAPYEFRPLISPIFGVSEHEQNHRPAFVATAEVQNDSHLQTVISPYYGAIHKDPKTSSTTPVEPMPTPITPVKTEPVVEKPVVVEPVVENLSLDALIDNEPEPVTPTPSEPEDHEQFSLFGDDK
jgi:hypothetical protein